MRKLFVLIAIFLTILPGCAALNPQPVKGVLSIKDQNISLNQLKTIVHEALPLGVREISPNGREFLSQQYIYTNNEYLAAGDAPSRYYARILILNETRPYDIELEVRHEVRYDRDGRIRYLNRGNDLALVKLLRNQLHDRLAKRRDDLNVIDDFRAF